MPNEMHVEATHLQPEVVKDHFTPMETLQDANEHLTLATLHAQEDAEASAGLSEKLRRLVQKLEASEAALWEKNMELEKFHDLVVDRELTLIRVEKENGQLRLELDRLRSEARKP